MRYLTKPFEQLKKVNPSQQSIHDMNLIDCIVCRNVQAYNSIKNKVIYHGNSNSLFIRLSE